LKSLNRRKFPWKKRNKLNLFASSGDFGKINVMSEKAESNLEKKLRNLIETIDVANALTEPLTASIENLLTVTASEMNSEEASVLIRDGEEGDLRFLSAIGKVADQLKNLRVPAGKGIAGFVFSSGQPMAVADAGEEETFYAEVDKQTGYSTQTILATPLRHNGEVIGVLEYINRIGDPPFEAFTPIEMDKAALFAEAVASLVNAYELAKLFRELGDKMVEGEKIAIYTEVREWLSKLRSAAEHKEMLDLAILIREIASRGEAEREMCRELLEAIVKFSDSKNETSFLSY
jgi:signal transduction protein with GAF and PtsI domain